MSGNANANRSACEVQWRAARSVASVAFYQSTRSHRFRSLKTVAPWSHGTSESFRELRVRRIPYFSEIFLRTVLLQLIATYFLKEFSSPSGMLRRQAVAATDSRPHNPSIPHNDSSDEGSSEPSRADSEMQMVSAPATSRQSRTRLEPSPARNESLNYRPNVEAICGQAGLLALFPTLTQLAAHHSVAA